MPIYHATLPMTNQGRIVVEAKNSGHMTLAAAWPIWYTISDCGVPGRVCALTPLLRAAPVEGLGGISSSRYIKSCSYRLAQEVAVYHAESSIGQEAHAHRGEASRS
jgi:hypothetical protein